MSIENKRHYTIRRGLPLPASPASSCRFTSAFWVPTNYCLGMALASPFGPNSGHMLTYSVWPSGWWWGAYEDAPWRYTILRPVIVRYRSISVFVTDLGRCVRDEQLRIWIRCLRCKQADPVGSIAEQSTVLQSQLAPCCSNVESFSRAYDTLVMGCDLSW